METGTGLVENEVTRRGNSSGEGKVRGKESTRGRAKGQRAGRKITSNICSRAVPGRCRREKSANQEKLSPGDSERILFETNTRGEVLVQSYDFVICRNPRALRYMKWGVSRCHALMIKRVTDSWIRASTNLSLCQTQTLPTGD